MPESRSTRAILCPVDLSPNARNALRYGAALCGRVGARLHVLFVDDPLLREAARQIGDTHRSAETMANLRRFVARALPPRDARRADCHVAVGPPAEKILSTAAAHGCDLIVMGTQGIGGVRKWLIGSTTRDVLMRSRIPVLAIPRRR